MAQCLACPHDAPGGVCMCGPACHGPAENDFFTARQRREISGTAVRYGWGRLAHETRATHAPDPNDPKRALCQQPHEHWDVLVSDRDWDWDCKRCLKML